MAGYGGDIYSFSHMTIVCAMEKTFVYTRVDSIALKTLYRAVTFLKMATALPVCELSTGMCCIGV